MFQGKHREKHSELIPLKGLAHEIFKYIFCLKTKQALMLEKFLFGSVYFASTSTVLCN
jgi:hypothetical protein